MGKDVYYFPHDYDPISDPKLSALIGEFGAVGYGLYWRIVEMLHSEEEHKLKHKEYVYMAIAKQMGTNVEQVSKFLDYATNTCELFKSDLEYFWSDRVLRNIQKREDVSDKRRRAGKISAESRKKAPEKASETETNVEQMLNKCSTPVEQNPTKERKVKESKVNTIVSNKLDTPEKVFSAASQTQKREREINFESIIETYHSYCPSFPRILKITDSRKAKIRIRLEEMKFDFKLLHKIFESVEKSKFLRGDNKTGWKASFDWIFENSKNWVKIAEGNYSDKTTSSVNINSGIVLHDNSPEKYDKDDRWNR